MPLMKKLYWEVILMFTKVNYYMVNLMENEDVAQIMKMASRHNIVAIHKIGVYEDTQQDELFCKGRWIDMYRFTKELNRTRATKK